MFRKGNFEKVKPWFEGKYFIKKWGLTNPSFTATAKHCTHVQAIKTSFLLTLRRNKKLHRSTVMAQWLCLNREVPSGMRLTLRTNCRILLFIRPFSASLPHFDCRLVFFNIIDLLLLLLLLIWLLLLLLSKQIEYLYLGSTWQVRRDSKPRRLWQPGRVRLLERDRKMAKRHLKYFLHYSKFFFFFFLLTAVSKYWFHRGYKSEKFALSQQFSSAEANLLIRWSACTTGVKCFLLWYPLETNNLISKVKTRFGLTLVDK